MLHAVAHVLCWCVVFMRAVAAVRWSAKTDIRLTGDAFEVASVPLSRKLYVLFILLLQYVHELVPFGCKASFHDDAAKKFGVRKKVGVVVGYAALAGYRVLDYESYADNRTVRIVDTRDVLIDRFQFPLRDLKFESEELDYTKLSDAVVLTEAEKVEGVRR